MLEDGRCDLCRSDITCDCGQYSSTGEHQEIAELQAKLKEYIGMTNRTVSNQAKRIKELEAYKRLAHNTAKGVLKAFDDQPEVFNDTFWFDSVTTVLDAIENLVCDE